MHSNGRDPSHSLALAIACFLVQLGCDPDVRNRKNKTCSDLIADVSIKETLMSYVQHRQGSSINLTTKKPLSDPSSNDAKILSSIEPTQTVFQATSHSGVECVVCCENLPSVRFEPCGHIIACSDCALRMKKCLECHVIIASKTTSGNLI